MAASSWTPGHRRVPGKLNPMKFHRNVTALATLGAVSVTVYEADAKAAREYYDQTAADAAEQGPTTLLSVKFGIMSPGALIDLSRFTEAELDCFKTIINEAIERARPAVQLRDNLAKEAEANGDYSYERSHRPDPKLVIQPRKV